MWVPVAVSLQTAIPFFTLLFLINSVIWCDVTLLLSGEWVLFILNPITCVECFRANWTQILLFFPVIQPHFSLFGCKKFTDLVMALTADAMCRWMRRLMRSCLVSCCVYHRPRCLLMLKTSDMRTVLSLPWTWFTSSRWESAVAIVEISLATRKVVLVYNFSCYVCLPPSICLDVGRRFLVLLYILQGSQSSWNSWNFKTVLKLSWNYRLSWNFRHLVKMSWYFPCSYSHFAAFIFSPKSLLKTVFYNFVLQVVTIRVSSLLLSLSILYCVQFCMPDSC